LIGLGKAEFLSHHGDVKCLTLGQERVADTIRAAPRRHDHVRQVETNRLNSLTSRSSQRSYDHAIREFIDWYCSEPRLAFNKTVVTRYRITLEQAKYASSTINLRLGVRGCRLRASEPRSCGWNQAGQGRKEAWHAHRQLG
jgi:hypothetical protein